jgi:hypothetical protein
VILSDTVVREQRRHEQRQQRTARNRTTVR